MPSTISIGTVVQIRTDLIANNRYDGVSFASSMVDYLGTTQIVEEIGTNDFGERRYRLRNVFPWTWSAQMFVGHENEIHVVILDDEDKSYEE